MVGRRSAKDPDGRISRMPFQAVATQRLYEQVAGQVTDLVARVGAGAFVTDKAKNGANGSANGRLFEGAGSSPLELIAARRTIEPEVAALAAKLATRAEIEAIAETVAMIGAATDTPSHRSADHLFHVRIGLASHNS